MDTLSNNNNERYKLLFMNYEIKDFKKLKEEAALGLNQTSMFF